MSKERKINFFTCCDESYEDFIPLFCLSILKFVPDCRIEICVQNLARTQYKMEDAIKYLKSLSSKSIVIREVETSDAAKTRFTINVKNKTEYVYITDIDVITLRGDIIGVHTEQMKKSGLPYSNAIRSGTERMTGMHFTKFEAYYPVALKGLDLNCSDEEALYKIVQARDIGMPTEFFRPMFGIHMSPNRYAIDEVGWEMRKYQNQWMRFRESKEFNELFPMLSGRIKNCVLLIDLIYKNDLLQHPVELK